MILIAEDEPMVVRVITMAVSNAGFRVCVVNDGVAGFEEFRHFGDEICLVLTDVVMPDGGGIEMALKIREIDPDVKILFMSGYSDAVLEVQARTNYPFIRKPFLPADLIRKINDVLGISGTATAGASRT
jgi:two-component system cell cycle sensor histidine kinase/response regulator CckA